MKQAVRTGADRQNTRVGYGRLPAVPGNRRRPASEDREDWLPSVLRWRRHLEKMPTPGAWNCGTETVSPISNAIKSSPMTLEQCRDVCLASEVQAIFCRPRQRRAGSAASQTDRQSNVFLPKEVVSKAGLLDSSFLTQNQVTWHSARIGRNAEAAGCPEVGQLSPRLRRVKTAARPES